MSVHETSHVLFVPSFRLRLQVIKHSGYVQTYRPVYAFKMMVHLQSSFLGYLQQ